MDLHVNDLQEKDFIEWLRSMGVTFLDRKLEGDIVRYQFDDKLTSLAGLSQNVAGKVLFLGWASKHYRSFLISQGSLTPKQSDYGVNQITRLKRRDGPWCFYCGNLLGDDVTIEHLLPKSVAKGQQQGGRNVIESLKNKALSHSRCNALAGDKSIPEKMRLRDKLRGYTNEPSRDEVGREQQPLVCGV